MAGKNKITPEEAKKEIKNTEQVTGNLSDANKKMAMIIAGENASLHVEFLTFLQGRFTEQARTLADIRTQVVEIARSANKYFDQHAGVAGVRRASR